MELEAFIDCFSGKENPRWKLSQAEVELLQTRLKDLKKCEPVTENPKLGYRGMCVVNCDNDLDFPKKIVAYNSCIRVVKHNGNVQYLKDETDIEGWLKSQAEEKGYRILT